DGSVPGIGWTGENDWTGFVPFDDLPRAYNPPDHFLATANNKNYGTDFKYNISAYWAAPYRIERIMEMLKAKEKLSVDDMKALQSIEGLLDKPDDPLWDRKDTPQVEKRDDILARSLTEATGELAASLGDNMQDWTWGKIHEITPRHEFSSADLVGGLFTLPSSPI